MKASARGGDPAAGPPRGVSYDGRNAAKDPRERSKGALLFARYAFMPNRLGYCGGPDAEGLLDYCIAGFHDPGLDELIRRFQAAYPNLRFIAEATGIGDPLHPSVVEAYWLGNDLLSNVPAEAFHRYLDESIAKRIPPRLRKYVTGKVPAGARLHHSFHVLDVSRRTGALAEDLTALDACRVSPGVVESVNGDSVTVIRRPLVAGAGGLQLGEPESRQVLARLGGKGYLPVLEPGDMVSLHWDWVCDVITPAQAVRLDRETRRHMMLANRTL